MWVKYNFCACTFIFVLAMPVNSFATSFLGCLHVPIENWKQCLCKAWGPNKMYYRKKDMHVNQTLPIHTYTFTARWSWLPILLCPHSSFAINFRYSLEFVIVVTMNCACVVFITSGTCYITMSYWETVSTPLSAAYHGTTLLSVSFQTASTAFTTIRWDR